MLSEREANSYNIFVNPKIKAIGITIKISISIIDIKKLDSLYSLP